MSRFDQHNDERLDRNPIGEVLAEVVAGMGGVKYVARVEQEWFALPPRLTPERLQGKAFSSYTFQRCSPRVEVSLSRAWVLPHPLHSGVCAFDSGFVLVAFCENRVRGAEVERLAAYLGRRLARDRQRQSRLALGQVLDHCDQQRSMAARLLHKGPCQELTAARFELEAAGRADQTDLTAVAALLDKAAEGVRQVLDGRLCNRCEQPFEQALERFGPRLRTQCRPQQLDPLRQAVLFELIQLFTQTSDGTVTLRVEDVPVLCLSCPCQPCHCLLEAATLAGVRLELPR